MKKIYFLVLLIAFASCEKDEVEMETSLTNLLQTSFDPEMFSETLPYEYMVDWNAMSEGYSESLQTNFMEFPIVYTSNFNPVNLNIEAAPTYTIMAVEAEGSFVFYLNKFLSLEQKNAKVSLLHPNNFTGTVKTMDAEGRTLSSKWYYNGVFKTEIKELSKNALAKNPCYWTGPILS